MNRKWNTKVHFECLECLEASPKEELDEASVKSLMQALIGGYAEVAETMAMHPRHHSPDEILFGALG